MAHPRLPFLLKYYFRNELPGWGKLMRITKVIGTGSDAHWKGAPTKTIRGKLHGYQMKLDLSNWSQRMTYFLGRYYELHLAKLLDVLLTPGARFVDIGGNIGMITLHAAKLVTSNGKVDCFEPNPDCVNSLAWHLQQNDIGHVELRHMGLSDTEGKATLYLTSDHSGTGSLAHRDGGESDVVRTHDVLVRTGDEELLRDARSPQLIKIDVEGYEYKVLLGLEKTLRKFNPFVITELVDEHLSRAGTSISEISKYMNQLGYRAYGITITNKSFGRRTLRLVLLPDLFADTDYSDTLWVHRTKSLPKLS